MLRPVTNHSLPQVVDSTIINEYTSCFTKGFYSFQANLGPLGGSPDLIAGGAFAKGLEVFRKHYYGRGEHARDIAGALHQGMLAAILELGTYQFPEHKAPVKGPDRILEALGAYVQRFNPETDHLQPYFKEDGEPAVEFTFSVPLPINHPDTGNPFLYAGRFDMLGLYKGQLLVDDEKTCSQLGPTWARKWNLRAQFTGYVWACQQYGLETIGAVVRGVRFTKTAFSITESFMETLEMRAKWQLEQWYENMLFKLERMVQAYKDGLYEQAFGDACAEWSGCPFMQLCASPNPENWIEGKYAKRSWNPLDKNPVGIPEDAAAEMIALPSGVNFSEGV